MAIGAPKLGTVIEPAAEATSAVPYPAGLAAKDIMVLMGSVSNAAQTADVAGWTTVKSASATGNTVNPNIFIAYKVATGSESGTLAVPHNNNVSLWQIIAFAGVDNVTVQDIAAAASFVDTTGDITYPDRTPATTGATAVVIGAVAGSTSTTTWGNSFTETADKNTGTRAASIAYKQALTTSAIGTTLQDFSGTGASLGQMIFLRAATAAAISSASSTTFTQNSAGTFTVTTTGTGPMTIAQTGTRPSGVTFTDNGNGTATLAGTPTNSGDFALTITPTGQLGAGSGQSFTLHVTAVVTFDATKSETLMHALQRVSGTTLDLDGAANAWAGTTGLALIGALNAKAGTTGLDIDEVLNKLATGNANSGYGMQTCAANLV